MRWLRRLKPAPRVPVNRYAIEIERIRPIIAQGICPVCAQKLEAHAGASCCPCCRGAYSVTDEAVSLGACDIHRAVHCEHWEAALASETGSADPGTPWV